VVGCVGDAIDADVEQSHVLLDALFVLNLEEMQMYLNWTALCSGKADRNSSMARHTPADGGKPAGAT
jgi:hypothetical protein